MTKLPRTRSDTEVTEHTFGARPTGFERADAINIRIPVEGADIGLVAEGA